MRKIWAVTTIALGLFVSASQAATIANSEDDWTPAEQGVLGWTSGYYNLTDDADETYAVDDFMEFSFNDSGEIDPDGDNHWDGNIWVLYRDTNPQTGPWTRLGQLTGHPNGVNSPPPVEIDDSTAAEHWAVRRWESTYEGEATLISELRAPEGKGCTGTGTTVHLFHNGELVNTVSNANSTTWSMGAIGRQLAVGDILDLALTPEDPAGNRGDGCDNTEFRLTVTDDPPPPPPMVAHADSVEDFSGNQGQDGWFYGYYNLREDAEDRDGEYGSDDFIEFLRDGTEEVSADPEFGAWQDGENHWNGTKWDILANQAPVGHGPWTEITQNGAHPAANAQGDEEVHWAVRRWVSDSNGDFNLVGSTGNGSGNADGTFSRIFVDGEEVWSELTNGTTTDFDLDLTLSVGSIVDFIVDPDGSEVYDPGDLETLLAINDGADSTVFTAQFFLLGGGLPGDYNGDGMLDAVDIDLLSTAVRNGETGAEYDLDSSGAVDAADRTFWIVDLKNTFLGDSNMDLEFNSSDLVQVFSAGEYEDVLVGNSTWGTGDWNGDGEFNSSDIVDAFSMGGYENGPRAGVAAVPEPASISLMLMALAGLVSRRRVR